MIPILSNFSPIGAAQDLLRAWMLYLVNDEIMRESTEIFYYISYNWSRIKGHVHEDDAEISAYNIDQLVNNPELSRKYHQISSEIAYYQFIHFSHRDLDEVSQIAAKYAVSGLKKGIAFAAISYVAKLAYNWLAHFYDSDLKYYFYRPTYVEKLVFETEKFQSMKELKQYNWRDTKSSFAFLTGKVTAEEATTSNWTFDQINALRLDGISAEDVIGKDWNEVKINAFKTGRITPQEAYQNQWSHSKVWAFDTGKLTLEQALSREWEYHEVQAIIIGAGTYEDIITYTLKTNTQQWLIHCNMTYQQAAKYDWSDYQAEAICLHYVPFEQARAHHWTTAELFMLTKTPFESLSLPWTLSEICCLTSDSVAKENSTALCHYRDHPNLKNFDSFGKEYQECIEFCKGTFYLSNNDTVYNLTVPQIDCFEQKLPEAECLYGEDAGSISV